MHTIIISTLVKNYIHQIPIQLLTYTFVLLFIILHLSNQPSSQLVLPISSILPPIQLCSSHFLHTSSHPTLFFPFPPYFLPSNFVLPISSILPPIQLCSSHFLHTSSHPTLFFLFPPYFLPSNFVLPISYILPPIQLCSSHFLHTTSLLTLTIPPFQCYSFLFYPFFLTLFLHPISSFHFYLSLLYPSILSPLPNFQLYILPLSLHLSSLPIVFIPSLYPSSLPSLFSPFLSILPISIFIKPSLLMLSP